MAVFDEEIVAEQPAFTDRAIPSCLWISEAEIALLGFLLHTPDWQAHESGHAAQIEGEIVEYSIPFVVSRI